jgi:hypothetical protein
MQRMGHPVLALLGVCVFVSVYAAETSSSTHGADSPQPFVQAWRVILKGEGAEPILLADRDWILEERKITDAELDEVERLLLPALASDLMSEQSAAQPSEYYRQYAAARWKGYHIILIHGFHRSYLDSYGGSAAEKDRWKREAVQVTDGGTHYWDAIYIIELHMFAKMRQDGGTTRTVAFHGRG